MPTLHALRHVSSAVRHAEALADEADDLGEVALAKRLRDHAAAVAVDLETAIMAIDEVKPSQDARARAHAVLSAVYAQTTMRLDEVYSPEDVSRLSPGGHLDVSERVRFRLRQLPQSPLPEILGEPHAQLDLRAQLERALFHYDAAVDEYLLACGKAQSRKDRAVVKSQALRLELERAKHTLLVQAPVESETYRRIKRRAVRTKRARWLDEAKAQRLLASALAV